MKKKAIVLTLALTLSLGLAACNGGSKAASDVSAAPGEAPTEGSVVNFYYATDLNVTLDPMIAKYNELYPGVEIVSHTMPNDDYDDKLKVLMAGSASDLDLMWIRTPTLMRQYIGNKALEDMTPFAQASGVDLEPIRETALVGSTNTEGTAFFGLPFSGSCWMLFYNPAMFDAKGIEYPINITWDEYRSLAMQFTEEVDGQKNWGGLIPTWTLNLGASSAGEYLTDPAPLTRTMNYAELLYNFYTGDKSHISLEEMSSGMFDPYASFANGNVAMMINGDWSFRLIPNEFKYAAAPLPVFDDVPEGSTVGQSSYFSVSAKSPNKQAAYNLAEFISTSAEGTSIIAKTDVPSYATEAALDVYKQSVSVPGVEYRFSSKVGLEQLPIDEYNAANEAFDAELQLYLLGEQDLETTFNNFYALREEA